MVSVSFVQGVLSHPRWSRNSEQQQRRQQKTTTRSIPISAIVLLAIIWIPAAIISLSRTVALSKYYSAPLLLYAQISDAIAKEEVLSSSKLEESDYATSSTTIVVCTCGEWYRFPSSFFIESKSKSSNVVFGFAPSTFTGQLPQLFTKEGSGPPTATITNQFNDKNQPEAGSYTPLESCDFLIELSTSLHSCIEQQNKKGINDDDMQQWNPIVQVPFFDAETTTSTLHRILYVPHLHEHAIQTGKVRYNDFVLYTR